MAGTECIEYVVPSHVHSAAGPGRAAPYRGGVAGCPPRIESQVAIDAPTSSAAIPRMASTREARPRSDHRLGGLDPETCVGHIQRTLRPAFLRRQRDGITVLAALTLCQAPHNPGGLSGLHPRTTQPFADPNLLSPSH